VYQRSWNIIRLKDSSYVHYLCLHINFTLICLPNPNQRVPAFKSHCGRLASNQEEACLNPSSGYARALAAAATLHFDDENLPPDVTHCRKEKPEEQRRKAEENMLKRKQRIGTSERRKLWAANGNDCTNERRIIDVAGIGAMARGIDGGANSSLHLSKTDLTHRDATVGKDTPLQHALVPLTGNTVAQEMSPTRKRRGQKRDGGCNNPGDNW
jgi:hypothetical protein